MSKGFTKTDFIGDGVELYVPTPPKDLMQERKVLVLPFFINNQPPGSPGLQRINILFEYYPKKKKLVVENTNVLVMGLRYTKPLRVGWSLLASGDIRFIYIQCNIIKTYCPGTGAKPFPPAQTADSLSIERPTITHAANHKEKCVFQITLSIRNTHFLFPSAVVMYQP